MTDLISRADAIGTVLTYFIPRSHTGERREYEEDFVRTIFKTLPSADVEPTVIRSKTLMPTKDFKEWAKRIREENPNAIVIPCDAEVVSAEAVQGEWIRNDNGTYSCSVCQSWIPEEQHGYARYCLYCGAKMYKGGDTE